MTSETVGSLLAGIANSLQDGLRILMFADKRGWGPDEFEQVRALEEALDEAKKDFQDMAPLVNGQFYYENDRRHESLSELRVLCTKLNFHAKTFKDWLKTGGPINPMWARETVELRRELHRAQCRAAQRIYSADQEANSRCLGAFLVYRRLREQQTNRKGREGQALLPQWRQQEQQQQHQHEQQREQLEQEGLRQVEPANPYQNAVDDGRRASLEALVPDCNRVGSFERFGDQDVVFVCDYCDGHLVWEDMQRMPSTRTDPIPQTDTGYPNWQAMAKTVLTGQDKTVVFAPLAIANHLPPGGGVGWEARLWCPFCDEYTYYDQIGGEQTQYAQDDGGFPDLPSFQAHLEWHHTAMPVPTISSLPALPTSTKNCTVM